MRIDDWPIAEQPRKRLIARGAASLSEAELLSLCLSTGRPGLNAIDFARELLKAFGGLRKLLNANSDDLRAVRGLGPAKLAALKALPEIAARYYEERLPAGQAIRSPDDTLRFLTVRLRDRPYELFCCLYLDNRHRVIRFEELFRGTIDGASVYPREVVKAALRVNAAALILAHNHPSGVAEPSQADERITKRLKAALALVDIRLLDHLVIGDGESTSLSARGLI
ncbi:MAG: DNA repair protein RadC [Pseudomonadota bacterium]